MSGCSDGAFSATGGSVVVVVDAPELRDGISSVARMRCLGSPRSGRPRPCRSGRTAPTIAKGRCHRLDNTSAKLRKGRPSSRDPGNFDTRHLQFCTATGVYHHCEVRRRLQEALPRQGCHDKQKRMMRLTHQNPSSIPLRRPKSACPVPTRAHGPRLSTA